MIKRRQTGMATALAAVLALAAGPSFASSHREAPNITRMSKVDNTDVYAFVSYEPGRSGFVTIIANFQPGQNPGDGPNYYTMDPNAIYEIHIDNVGDGVEHLTYQFKFINNLVNSTGITLNIGGKTESIPLRVAGPISSPSDANQGEFENYSITQITGDRRSGTKASATLGTSGYLTFRKPLENIGNKTIPNYANYVNQFIYGLTIPGCSTMGRVFVGQRAEAFAVNLGSIFDLVNFVPIEGDSAPGAGDGKGFPGGITQNRANDDLVGKKNVTSIELELPISCINGGAAGNGVIGVWSTASLPQARLLDPSPTYASPDLNGGAYTQVSRLGNPLVNELVIGLPDKDNFNASLPKNDAQFLPYVTNPTFPAILDKLFNGPVNQTLGGTPIPNLAPSNFPRNDLVAVFLTGIPTLNQLKTVTPGEMMRLNTMVPPTPQTQQSNLGVLGNDLAGYPNGRRPGDDTVDITLRVAMGALCYSIPIGAKTTNLGYCTPSQAPVGNVPFTDGAPISAMDLQNAFPYLDNPIPGSPGHNAHVPTVTFPQ